MDLAGLIAANRLGLALIAHPNLIAIFCLGKADRRVTIAQLGCAFGISGTLWQIGQTYF